MLLNLKGLKIISMKIILFLFVLSFRLSANGQLFFTEYEKFLKDVSRNGLVDYQKVLEKKEQIKLITYEIENFSIDKKDSSELKAFYLNAYNFLVIKQIAQYFPLKSALDIPGFFDRKKFIVSGEELTLDQIEFEKLFSSFNDPRFHFALVSSGYGCPPISNEIYRPDKIESQLENRTKTILNLRWYIRIYPDKILVPKLFMWYDDHFPEGTLSFLKKYIDVDLPSDVMITFYEYDWTLNDISQGARLE